MKRPFKSALALGLAAALSISPAAVAPAQAGEKEQAIIAGTLGLFLLGSLAHAAANSNGNFSVTTQTPRTTYVPRKPEPKPHHPRAHEAPHRPTVVVPSRSPSHPRRAGHRKPDLPRACVIPVRSGTARGIYMSQSCLERSGVATHRMPHSCQVRLVNQGGHRARTGYSASCLSRAGYEIEGGRRGHR